MPQSVSSLPPQAPTIIRAENTGHSYGSRQIFHGVNLVLKAGDIALLAGPNGAGKSTLMKILAGFFSPAHGEVELGIVQEKVGYIGHACGMYEGLSGLENLLFWAKLGAYLPAGTGKAEAEKACMEALRAVELEKSALEKAGTYSRGMGQKLALAKLFLQKPLLLLLDEPATGLDTASRAILKNFVLERQMAGAATLWISHDVETDKTLANILYIVEKKTLRAEITALHNPKQETEKAATSAQEEKNHVA